MIDDHKSPASDALLADRLNRLPTGAHERSLEVSRPRWQRWLIVVVALAIVGFASWWHIVRPIRQNLRLRLSLTHFGLLYFSHQRDMGRSPRNIDELEAYIQSHACSRLPRECEMAQTALEMARDGRIYVVWDAWGQLYGSSQEYLAYESGTIRDAGLVLWTNCAVEQLTSTEFASPRVRPAMTYNQR